MRSCVLPWFEVCSSTRTVRTRRVYDCSRAAQLPRYVPVAVQSATTSTPLPVSVHELQTSGVSKRHSVSVVTVSALVNSSSDVFRLARRRTMVTVTDRCHWRSVARPVRVRVVLVAVQSP